MGVGRGKGGGGVRLRVSGKVSGLGRDKGLDRYGGRACTQDEQAESTEYVKYRC